MNLLILLSLLSVSYGSTLPRPDAERVAYIVASTQGNLPSASRDVFSYTSTFSRLNFTINHILDTSDRLTSDRRMLDLQANRLSSLDALKDALLDISKVEHPLDLIITLSSHGWCGGYIRFKQDTYRRNTFREWLAPLKNNKYVNGLILVDTCYSGTLIGLTASRPTGQAKIASISACNDHERVSDDISDLFGFGGGLTSCVMDYLKDKTLTVEDLYLYCRRRLQRQGIHPQLRWL